MCFRFFIQIVGNDLGVAFQPDFMCFVTKGRKFNGWQNRLLGTEKCGSFGLRCAIHTWWRRSC